jgi:hypothetical protein
MEQSKVSPTAAQIAQLLGERIRNLKLLLYTSRQAKLKAREVQQRRAKNKLARVARKINSQTRKQQTGNRSRGR